MELLNSGADRGLRLVCPEDLPAIRKLYQEIVQDMERKNIFIWDEIYPNDFFPEDIRRRRLYALFDGAQPIAAFALCPENGGESAVRWPCPAARAYYIDRLGVSPARAGQGIGARMLQQAQTLARAAGADSLRLFVAEYNLPAIRLYEKCGFARAEGIYPEPIPGSPPLRQNGYEKML